MTLPQDISGLSQAELLAVTQRPCIIIHTNVLVAEDLRDILESAGGADVQTGTNIAQVPTGLARVVLISGDLDALINAPQVQYWKENAIPVILLDSGQHSPRALQAGFHVLDEPFRTEDVVALLENLKVF